MKIELINLIKKYANIKYIPTEKQLEKELTLIGVPLIKKMRY